jgi:hypothetical protein
MGNSSIQKAMGQVPEPVLAPLTQKMKVFADEYISGAVSGKPYNANAALKVAKYGERCQNSYGSRLLRHPSVQAYIEKRLNENSISAAEIVSRWSDIARFNVGEVVKLDPTGTHVVFDPKEIIKNRTFIKSFGTDSNGNPKIEFHDPTVALQQLTRIRGLTGESGGLMGGGGAPVTVVVVFVNPDGGQVGPVPQQLPPPEPEEDWETFEAELEELDDDETV